jgi:hypothetical protein
MNTTAKIAAPQPLLSTTSRVVAALGVVAVLAVALLGTARASHEAVDTCAHAFTRSTTVHATLPRVEIVGRREAATAKGA